MNQVLLNKESIFLIRDTITNFSESISTKKILTLETINDKSFDKDVIEKITSHEKTLADYLVAIQSNAGDIISIKNAQTAAAAATAAVDTKANNNATNINLQNNEIGAQNTLITNFTTNTADNSNQITAILSLLNDWREILNKVPGINVPKI
jgi:hypothetical protein